MNRNRVANHLAAPLTRSAISFDSLLSRFQPVSPAISHWAAKVHATMRRARIVTLPDGVKDVGELWAAGYAASWAKENLG